MSSKHPAVSYQIQDAYPPAFTDPIPMFPLQTDTTDLERFMMEGTNTSRHSLSHTPPQSELMHQQQFANYHFPYNNMMESGMHNEQHINQSLESHGLSGQHDQPSHRASLTSLHGDHRSSTSSMHGERTIVVTPASGGRSSLSHVPSQSRHISISGGSDRASPINNVPTSSTFNNDDFGLSGGANVNGLVSSTRQKEDKKEAPPSWTELKTKAGKERKRLPLACIACRRKKIKCSGEKPACKHCIRSRIPCVYKVTTRKAAPRTDYMAMLDKRLKRMEERIIKIVPVDEQSVTTASVARANVKPAIPGTHSPKSSRKRTADEAFDTSLDDWSNAPSGSNIDNAKPPSLMVQEAEETQLLTEGAEFLPSKDIQEHLAEVFFAHIYGQTYHLLHKPSYLRKLRSGTLPPVLVLAVCAISARFSTHPKLSTQPAFLRGEEWASKAREIVTRRYEWPNVTVLTCLLILGLHEFGTCHGGRSWSLGGQAIRMAYALQLHQDLDHDPHRRSVTSELSFIDREIRRRTMWSCFLMDRFNSSGTDRPTFIKEETIKVQLPIKERMFQLDMPGPTEDLLGNVPHAIPSDAGQLADAKENMGVAAYMVRSIALWGRVINYLNLGGSDQETLPKWHPDSHFSDLIRQTEEFDATLPQTLKYNSENLRIHQTEGLDNQYLFLHISTQQNILFMNRFAVPGQPGAHTLGDAPKEFLTRAGTKAFKAANKISEILSASTTHFVTAPFAGYCVFLSSTVHISGIFSQNQALEQICKKNLSINVTYITKMKKYWGMFHWMAENLKEQYRICAEAAKSGKRESIHLENTSANVFQYGDWFDRYPHGVKQTDYDETGRLIKKEDVDEAVLGQKSDYATVEEFFNTLPAPGSRKPEPTKLQRNKVAKKSKVEQQHTASPHQQTSASTASPQARFPPKQQQQSQPYQQIQQQRTIYHDLSPTNHVDMSFNSQPSYMTPPSTSIPSHQQAQFGIMPQLDRQFVFNSYSNIDASQDILDSMQNNWNDGMGMSVSMGNVAPTVTSAEATSAWFMPFNMVPPEINVNGDMAEGFGAFGAGARMANFGSAGEMYGGNGVDIVGAGHHGRG